MEDGGGELLTGIGKEGRRDQVDQGRRRSWTRLRYIWMADRPRGRGEMMVKSGCDGQVRPTCRFRVRVVSDVYQKLRWTFRANLIPGLRKAELEEVRRKRGLVQR